MALNLINFENSFLKNGILEFESEPHIVSNLNNSSNGNYVQYENYDKILKMVAKSLKISQF